MANEILVKNYTAEAAIGPYRIVKFGAADGGVVQAAAAADLSFGVCGAVGPALGERCDVVLMGIADVEFGAAVTRGQALTSDASGRAVVAVAGDQMIGRAQVSGVLGDIAPVLITVGVW